MSDHVTRRPGTVTIGTLRAGSTILAAPDYLRERGVLYVAVHPEEAPRLVTPTGIHELVFIPPP